MTEQMLAYRYLADHLFAGWMTGRDEDLPTIQLLEEDFEQAKDGVYFKKDGKFVPSDFHSQEAFKTPRFRLATTYPHRLMRHSLVIAQQALEKFV